MLEQIKNILRKWKKSLLRRRDRFLFNFKSALGYTNTQNLNFDEGTLPFLDRKEYSFETVIKNIPTFGDLPYDLKEKLDFFRENGFVVLENCMPLDAIDKIWNEIEYLTENHEKFDIDALVYQFNDHQETPVRIIPKEKLKSIGTRFIDYHDSSVNAKNFITHPNLTPFLQASLAPDVSVFQSLIFKYSSQQDVHQDFPWVTTKIPSHLAAAWIPMEDVHVDSGPLFYYPKSHLIPKFDFGKTGILYDANKSLFNPKEFSDYLTETCEKYKLKKQVLLIKKGDVLFWHGALAHGGMPINDSQKTRKSFVVHYSTVQGNPHHRRASEVEVNPDKYNGVTIYTNPILKHQKDIINNS